MDFAYGTGMTLFILTACVVVPDPPPGTCDEIQASFDSELAAAQSCEVDADCGQVLTGTSCGCTNNLVASLDADTTALYESVADAAEGGCDLGLVSDCSCPTAYGFECSAGACAWAYPTGPWLPDCQADRGDVYELGEASLAGDTLTVTLSAGGGCQTHDWVLCWPDGTFAESAPVQARLEVWHDDHDDPCEAYLTEDVAFDLAPLQSAWHDAYGNGAGTITVVIGDDLIPYAF